MSKHGCYCRNCIKFFLIFWGDGAKLLNKFELNGRIRKMLLSKQGEYNLTNQQMADILHITPRTYSNILSDKTHEIRISVVYYAVKYFNVNVYELIKE